MADESEQVFEARLERRLRAYADVPVAAFDADRIARGSIRSRRGSDRLGTLLAAAILALLLAAAFAIAIGSQDQDQLLVDARSTATPREASPTVTTPSPTPPRALTPDLEGSWMAEVPEDIVFGAGRPDARMSLVIDGGTSVFIILDGDPVEHAAADIETTTPDEARVITRGATQSITVAGAELRGCVPDEAGTYRLRRSGDGLLLTIEPIDDPCPSRAALLARTWTRSLGRANAGGLGVVDAFDQLFTVRLPSGSYVIERHTDALTIVQPVPEFQFLAFQDPQGFDDPCDPTAGRYAIESGADAFVDYFRQLRGFTVGSTTELTVDGHRAVRLVVAADLEGGCQNGHNAQWQPKAETGDQHWFLRPGDTDSLVIVELDDVTLMFEVLPAPHAQEDQVIGSIRFLETLASSP